MTKPEQDDRIEFAQASEDVKTVIRGSLFESDPLLSGMMRHLGAAEGKYFRAALLLAAAADEEDTVPAGASSAAAGLEILHLATLVHDDIIDDAPVRRGRSSVQAEFGKKSAVICGDYLFCRAFMLVAELSSGYTDRFTDMARAMTRICVGELRQFEHTGDTALTVRDYLKIVAGKTAALFSLSLYAGALLGENPEQEARLLARFGYYAGMMYQLADDCIDYETSEETAGKPVRQDLSQGVITLPLIYALMREPALRDFFSGGTPDPKGTGDMVREILALGGVERTKSVAQRYYLKARKLLGRVSGERRRERLGGFLEQIHGRNF